MTKVIVKCYMDSSFILLEQALWEDMMNHAFEMEFEENFDSDNPPPEVEDKINEKVQEWFFDIVNYSYSILPQEKNNV